MTERVLPVTPEDITAQKLKIIPNEVIEAFNELLASKFTNVNVPVTIKQPEIIDLIKQKMNPDVLLSSTCVFDYNWLNIENIYDEAGWNVIYDKPGYNESYDAFFKFWKK